MLNYEEYEKFLKNEAITYVIIMVVLIVALGALLIFMNKKFFDDMGKVGKIIVNTFICVVLISTSIYVGIHTYNAVSDINNKAYIVYEGEFEISSYREGYITIFDGEKEISLTNNFTSLSSGKYTGKLVYAKKSRILLECEASE